MKLSHLSCSPHLLSFSRYCKFDLITLFYICLCVNPQIFFLISKISNLIKLTLTIYCKNTEELFDCQDYLKGNTSMLVLTHHFLLQYHLSQIQNFVPIDWLMRQLDINVEQSYPTCMSFISLKFIGFYDIMDSLFKQLQLLINLHIENPNLYSLMTMKNFSQLILHSLSLEYLPFKKL